jgi:hypothetical protein
VIRRLLPLAAPHRRPPTGLGLVSRVTPVHTALATVREMKGGPSRSMNQCVLEERREPRRCRRAPHDVFTTAFAYIRRCAPRQRRRPASPSCFGKCRMLLTFLKLGRTRMPDCSHCHGEKTVSCLKCHGSGQRFAGFYIDDCKECAGTGKLLCAACCGTGVRAPPQSK